MGSRKPAIRGNKLDHPAPQNRPTTRNRASQLAFSSASHRRHRVGPAPAVNQSLRWARKKTRRYREEPPIAMGGGLVVDTIEESSSADDADARKKRSRAHRESRFSLHLKLRTGHEFYAITPSAHACYSCTAWHCAHTNCSLSTCRSLRLKSRASITSLSLQMPRWRNFLTADTLVCVWVRRRTRDQRRTRECRRTQHSPNTDRRCRRRSTRQPGLHHARS